MFKIRTLFNFIFPAIRDGELQIINVLIKCFQNSDKEKYVQQIKNINYVQRIDDEEIDFYCIRKGKVNFDENIRLSINQKEYKLATLRIKNPKNNVEIYIEAWLVNGYFFSLELDQPFSFKGIKEPLEIISLDCQ